MKSYSSLSGTVTIFEVNVVPRSQQEVAQTIKNLADSLHLKHSSTLNSRK